MPNLTEVKMTVLPKCSFCDKTAEYDFSMRGGRWAYGCKDHWEQYRMSPTLGTGIGQKLVQK